MPRRQSASFLDRIAENFLSNMEKSLWELGSTYSSKNGGLGKIIERYQSFDLYTPRIEILGIF